ncbi:MAG: phosphoribosylanthranilate isomerase [Burkholderiales bacterium]|nr:phosphoribosylanthranilate isomerase [Burkholderiales bacterium]
MNPPESSRASTGAAPASAAQGRGERGAAPADAGVAPGPGARRRTRIKICGLTREADVDAAVEAGADAVGFVLYPKSPRAVDAARAAALARRMPPFVTPVLLFVDAALAQVAAALQALPHALPQFHGDETPAQCEAAGRAYLRALRIRPAAGVGAPASQVDLLDCARAHPRAAALLLDAWAEGYGGGGKVFDWSVIPPGLPCPVVLSGGLNPANVGDGIARVRPWAVDVSSGVESAKGIKDAALMRRFCQAVRDADAALAAP